MVIVAAKNKTLTRDATIAMIMQATTINPPLTAPPRVTLVAKNATLIPHATIVVITPAMMIKMEAPRDIAPDAIGTKAKAPIALRGKRTTSRRPRMALATPSLNLTESAKTTPVTSPPMTIHLRDTAHRLVGIADAMT